jgi:LAS superfamily LD-carboxypeptidase LdcB
MNTTFYDDDINDDDIPEGTSYVSDNDKEYDMWVDKQLMYRFKAAQAAAKKDGQVIYIVSGYRTLNRQKTLYANAIRKYGSAAEASKWVAPPLVSHHPWGTAIDVNYPDEPVGAGWLEIHGSKFGLCRIFENEWWHFEPVIAPGWKCPALVPDATYSLN